MARKLVHICLAWTFVLGCWGGVLAAVACPHVGCETSAGAPDHDANHGEPQSGESQESAVPEDHSAHTGDHKGHAVETPAPEKSLPESAALMMGTSGAHDPCCTHCMGRPEAPPSPKFEWQSASVRKAVKALAAHSALKIMAPAASHVRQIAPAQHAPPGASDRQLLINVFRI